MTFRSVFGTFSNICDGAFLDPYGLRLHLCNFYVQELCPIDEIPIYFYLVIDNIMTCFLHFLHDILKTFTKLVIRVFVDF